MCLVSCYADTLMAESLTESELDTLGRDRDSSRPKQFGEMTLVQFLSTHGGPSNPVLPTADVGVKNDSTYLAESLYGSVMDVAIEADSGGADVGASRLISDDEKAVEKIISKGSRWLMTATMTTQICKTQRAHCCSCLLDSLMNYQDIQVKTAG